MRHFILLLCLGFASTVTANAAPCKTQGAVDAREINFDLKDPQVLKGLEIAFVLGLHPKEFPEADIAANTDPCSRGSFPFVNGTTMELRGEDGDTPPRWATSPAPGPTVYVAVVPQPGPALKFMEVAKRGGEATFNNGDMMYVVAMTRGDSKRYVFHVFDKIPDDARLKDLLRPIAVSQGRVQLIYDLNARRLTVGE